jgi:hypothetical protein
MYGPQVMEPVSLTVDRGVWITGRKRNRTWATLWGALGLVFFGTSLYAVIGRGQLHVADRIGIAAFCLVPATLCLKVAVGCARAGLLIGDDAVVIRGPLKAWTVPIADAERFSSGVQSGAGNGTPGVILTVRNRRPISIWALGREGFVWDINELANSFGPTVDKLNALLPRSSTTRPPQAGGLNG